MSEKSAPAQKVQWLDAFSDPVANVRAYSSGLELAALDDNGENRLVVADLSGKLRVYADVRLASENVLLDAPVAMCSYYMDEGVPHIPVVAVATSIAVYVYRGMRPFYKFAVPPLPLHAQEAAVWDDLTEARCDVQSAHDKLHELRQRGVALTPRSLDFLDLEGADKLEKNKEDPRAVGCLILGTEAAQVLILEPNASSVLHKIQLKSQPVFMACAGLLEVEYRIVVACRNRCVYTIKNGEVSGVAIELEVQPVALVIVNKHIFVGCMNSTVQAYQIRGRKSYTLYMPAPVLAMELLHHPLTNSKALLVSLGNSEVRLYNEANKSLISVIKMESPVMAMRFGQYGRERGVLVLVTQNGALEMKILSRASTNLQAFAGLTGPPPEQEIPLKIPKKTSLYVEQTQREREHAADMHTAFQRELYRLRLNTARAYVKVMTDQQGPISYYAGSSLRLSANVQGLGPVYRLRLFIENTGKRTICGVPIIFSYNHLLYRVKRPYGELPVLVPGLPYHFEAKVTCMDDRGATEPITVFVCSAQSSLPIIMAVVQMPLTDFLFA
eukprot:m51a1_g7926 hypothetical protein (555) ;mRNA; f:39757-42289